MDPNQKTPSLSLLSKIINIFYGLFFVLLGLLYFFMSVIGFLTVFAVKSTVGGYTILFNLFSSPLLMLVGVLFIMHIKKRYLIGLSLLFLLWFITQLNRFFMITNHKLEMVDFTNLLFFGIPFLILLISKYLDKDRIGNNSPIPTPTQVLTSPVNQPQTPPLVV